MRPLLIFGFLIVFSACGYRDVQDMQQVEYDSFGMGGSTHIRVSKDSVVIGTSCYYHKHNYWIDTGFQTPSPVWKSLQQICGRFNIHQLATLSSSSHQRSVDGADYTNIAIRFPDTVYTSPTFDGGNPNLQLRPLERFLFDSLVIPVINLRFPPDN